MLSFRVAHAIVAPIPVRIPSAHSRDTALPQASPELSMLLAAVTRGDRSAFKALYDRTASKLLGVVLRIVRDRALAEEVLQETYLKIWQNASAYAPGVGQPMTWMMAIARHRAIDVIRKRTEVLREPDENGRDWLESVKGVENPEAGLIDRDGLGRCLDRLEAPQRDCIILAYCHGYSREELAARFERPVNTIKTWLHRSLGALKACLEAS